MPRIVIVDDQATNRSIFSKLAASLEEGIDVRAFADPTKALHWLSQHPADLLITDYKMPGMDGADFTRKVRSQPYGADIPIVVITVYDDRSFRLRALEAGATDFLQSPVDHHEFLTRARNLLRLREQQNLVKTRARALEAELRDSERSREEALRNSRERLAQVIDTVPAMISATDARGQCIFVNAFQAAFSGLTTANCVGSDVSALFGDAQAERSRTLDRLVFERGEPLPSYEEEIVDRAGIRRVFLVTKSPLRDTTGVVTSVLTTSLDITDQKRAQSHLRYLAHHDALTNLPNRTLLRQRLQLEVTRTLETGEAFALHFLDLDRFKGVNDTLGHHLGDRLLEAVAARLQASLRQVDMVARLGGDEFAIIQPGLRNNQDAAELAQRIIDLLAQPFDLNGRSISTSASLGITICTQDSDDVEELLRNADLAMYRAKAEGRNGYRFFVESMHRNAQTAMVLEASLRQGLADQEFVLYYQPQYDLLSGTIVGAEALLRWRKKEQDLLEPTHFLSYAEENGLIVPINEWALREACREAKGWQRHGLPPLRVAVNISPVQFRRQDVCRLVMDAIHASGLDACYLELELTERIIMDETENAVRSLRKLKDLGVVLALDDFGTGYSSLSHVKRFAVDRIKIDQSFVRNLNAGSADTAIVRAIISLGHGLNLKVIAEGVETAEQLAQLRAEACDEVQGFYFSRPLTADAFAALLQEEGFRRRADRPILARI